MKNLTMKKLSTAILAASCVLGVGVAQALPKVVATVTVPANTAGADKALATIYKGLPWLPCSDQATTIGVKGNNTKLTADQLQFDLNITNADDNKDGVMDYDLYVFFVNQAGDALSTAKSRFYALIPTPGAVFGKGAPKLKALLSSTDITANGMLNSSGQLSEYRYMANTEFNTAALKQTIFGGPITLEGLSLDQGMWNLLVIMVDPTVVDPTLSGANQVKLQNPGNWAGWTVQPFILGTPFGTANGIPFSTDADGDGTCH